MLHTISLQGGAALVLRTFEPATTPLAAIVVPSAMGVTQNFYARFAEWLAARGYLVATFDLFANAPIEYRRIAPRDVGVPQWLVQE